MFYVVKHRDYNGKNPFKRIYYKLFCVSHRTKLESCRLTDYGVITVRSVGNEPNVERINRALSPINRRLVLPKSLKNKGINAFSSDEFLKTVLFNSCEDIIKTVCHANPVAVIDPKAEYVRHSQQILRTADSVLIFTDHPQRYRCFSNDTLSRFGTDFILKPRESSSAQIDVIISPAEISPAVYINNHRFTLDEYVFYNSKLPNDIPSDITQADFFGACAKYGRHSELYSLKTEKLCYDGQPVFVTQLVQ